MIAEYLLDRNVLIDLLRGGGREARDRFRAASHRIAVSSISVFELEYGAARSHAPDANRAVVESLLSRVTVLPFDAPAAVHAGRIRAHLAARGTPIGPYDTLLAGAARAVGLTLVTGNVDEFQRVPGLAVERWF